MLCCAVTAACRHWAAPCQSAALRPMRHPAEPAPSSPRPAQPETNLIDHTKRVLLYVLKGGKNLTAWLLAQMPWVLLGSDARAMAFKMRAVHASVHKCV